MKLLQAIKDPYVGAGALGGLLALSVVLLHLPAAIYGGNVEEFIFGISAYLAFGLLLLAPAMIAIVLLLVALPRTPRIAVAGLLCGVGLVMWLYGSFFLGDTIVLDGRHDDFHFDTWLGAWEPAIALAGVVAIGVLVARYARPFVIFLAMLNAGLVLGTGWELVRDPRVSDPLRMEDSNGLFRFSTQGNVVLVLMDSLQADVFDRVANSDPAIRRSLDGFTLYRDAVGVAPTTVISIPAIHSGQLYLPGKSIKQYYEQGVRKGSFLNRLSADGFETALVNPIKNVCPEQASVCTSTALAIGKRGRELQKSALRLFDFAVFRVVPFSLKDKVYNHNEWLFSGITREGVFADSILMGNGLLEALGSRMQVNGGPPTAKFIHLQNTHPPFILEEDCRSISLHSAVANLDGQVRCSLLAFAALLEGMKRDGIYDGAAIAVVADHGYSMPSGYVPPGDAASDKWRRLIGAANPTFLLKPPGARGELARSDTPVSLADVAVTLCSLRSSACGALAGQDVTRMASPTPRLFTSYHWNHEWWQRAELPAEHLTRYAVRGPIWERGSWQLVDESVQAYRPGSTLGFQASSTRPVLSSLEWSSAEAQGTWADGFVANLVLKLDPLPAGDLELVTSAYAFLPAERPWQRAQVLVNDVEVSRWVFDQTNPDGLRSARIPRALLGSETMKITFMLPDAVSPSELGLSTDTRTLSIGLRAMRLTEFGRGVDEPPSRPSATRAGAP